MKKLFILGLLVAIVACKPHPVTNQPVDSTIVDTTIVDTTVTHPDSLVITLSVYAGRGVVCSLDVCKASPLTRTIKWGEAFAWEARPNAAYAVDYVDYADKDGKSLGKIIPQAGVSGPLSGLATASGTIDEIRVYFKNQ
jgi:hypothetical protein